MLMLVRVQGVR